MLRSAASLTAGHGAGPAAPSRSRAGVTDGEDGPTQERTNRSRSSTRGNVCRTRRSPSCYRDRGFALLARRAAGRAEGLRPHAGRGQCRESFPHSFRAVPLRNGRAAAPQGTRLEEPSGACGMVRLRSEAVVSDAVLLSEPGRVRGGQPSDVVDARVRDILNLVPAGADLVDDQPWRVVLPRAIGCAACRRGSGRDPSAKRIHARVGVRIFDEWHAASVACLPLNGCPTGPC
jgi:hypothetical protein